MGVSFLSTSTLPSFLPLGCHNPKTATTRYQPRSVTICCTKIKTDVSGEEEQFNLRRRDVLKCIGVTIALESITSSGSLVETANAADLIERRQRSEFQSQIKGTLYTAIKGKPDLVPSILRLAINDALTYDKETKTGGPNGSIRFSSEISRPENKGLSEALNFIEEAKKEIDSYSKGGPISYADLIQYAAQSATKAQFLASAIRKCGGNEEKGNLLYTAYGSNGQWGLFDRQFGRTDTQEPDPEGRIPIWEKATVQEMKDKFSAVGLGPRQVLSFFACRSHHPPLILAIWQRHYLELTTMAKVCKKFDNVADILPNQGSTRIKVRVLRLWKIPSFLNPSEISSIEMVLIDEKGAKIHASIRKQLLYLFESKIEEGEVYQMSCFAVAPEVGYYRATLHPYKLLFQIKTRLQPVKNSPISKFGLSLTKLAEVCSHIHDYEFLVDVIGLMTGISAEREYIRDGKITKMVIVELTDASGKCECALFGDYVDQLNKKMGKSGEGLPVIVVQFAKIKIFRDQASLQNVINTTRIFINPDIPEVVEFKNSIALHGIDVDSFVPVIGGRAKPAMDEEFLRMHPKMKISDLSDMEEVGVFSVYRVLTGIVQGEDWWYPACRCHKAVLPDSGAYYCNGCSKHVFQCIPRFRVKVEVSDGDSTCVFVLFDSDMSYIMEKSCAHFVGKAKVPNEGSVPAEFNALVGSKMLFIIDNGVNQSKIIDGTFRVKRVCSDSQIIKKFLLEGPFITPVKPMSQAIEIESDSDLADVDVVEDSQPMSFLKNIIVTPPLDAKSPAKEDPILASVKRNLVEQFDGASKVAEKKPIRRVRVKLEKE